LFESDFRSCSAAWPLMPRISSCSRLLLDAVQLEKVSDIEVC
jgi:hypothetical protein